MSNHFLSQLVGIGGDHRLGIPVNFFARPNCEVAQQNGFTQWSGVFNKFRHRFAFTLNRVSELSEVTWRLDVFNAFEFGKRPISCPRDLSLRREFTVDDQSSLSGLTAIIAGRIEFAFVTNNLDAVIARLAEAGFAIDKDGADEPYRRNIYFIDPDGFEVEFVQYLSDLPEERNLSA